MINRIVAFLTCLTAACIGGQIELAFGSDRDTSVFFGVTDEREQASVIPTNAPFYDDKERGWFWYEEDQMNIEEELTPVQDEEPRPKPEEKKEPDNSNTGPRPLSSEWFRKNMEKYRDQAIDNPSPENVTTYMYLQRVMLDKAEKFAEVSQRVVMADSLLDENTRRPIATFGGTAKDEMSTKGTEKAAKKLAQLAGLWFFYESNCEFCVKQAGVLKGLMNAYGFKVLAIARDGLPLPDGSFSNFTVDRGQSKKLGVEMTPALFLVKPGEQGGAIQLGQGLLAGDEIVKRTIVLAHQYAWLNEEEYEDTLKVSPIQVETEMIQNVRDNLMGNPRELIRTIRDNLKKQL